MRVLLTGAVYVVSLLLVTVVVAPLALVLAGPHSDLLPGLLQAPVWILGWLCVLVLPVLAAHRYWHHAVWGSRKD